MGRVIQFPAQNENLWLRRYEDGTIEIGIDDKGSWVWLLSLSLNDEGEFVIQDYVYHDALPDTDVHYKDIMDAIQMARILLGEPKS
jgi:hypothetical protein